MVLRHILTTVRAADVWVGSNYAARIPRLLILGESTYGSSLPLISYVPGWISGAVKDRTFSNLYIALSTCSNSLRSCSKTHIWDCIAFFNFVPGSIGTTYKSKASPSHFRSARSSLRQMVSLLAPTGVLILGLSQSDFSRPVIEQQCVPYVIVPHCGRAFSKSDAEFLGKSWDVLTRIAS